jgi:hypothetical protein
MSSLNVFLNTLEEIGLGKNDFELMRNMANKYKTTDILTRFNFLKLKFQLMSTYSTMEIILEEQRGHSIITMD